MRRSVLLLLCSLSFSTAAFAQSEKPLEGLAYQAADEAYASFKLRDYKHAADRVRDAIALRPDLLRLHLLLIDALIAAGQLDQAEQAATHAAQLFPDNGDVKTRLAALRQQLALGPADTAYKALANKNPNAAVEAARNAIHYAPDSLAYRLLLLNAQIANNDYAGALATANDAVALNKSDYVPLVWRAYIDQHMGNQQAATTDFDTALKLPGLDPGDEKNIRLIAADAAFASGDTGRVSDLLRQYSPTDPDVATRLNDAKAVNDKTATLAPEAKTLLLPSQDCQTTSSGTKCRLIAQKVVSRALANPPPEAPAAQPPAPVDPVADAANRAYQAQRDKDYKTAIDNAREAIRLDPKQTSIHALLLNLLVQTKQLEQADIEATAAIRQDPDNAELFAQRGYVRFGLKRYAAAMSDFKTALKLGVSAAQERGVRISLADAAQNAKQPAMVLAALKPLPLDYDVAIRRAYALQDLGRKQDALSAFTAAQARAATSAQRDTALRARIALMVQLGQKPEALALFRRSLEQHQLSTVSPADLGYLAAQAGDDVLAVEYFDRARAVHQLPAPAYLDAGYAAKRTIQNQKAVNYLAQGIDNYQQGLFSFDQQQLFDVRRQITDLTRTWGINTAVIYGKVGSAFSPFVPVPTSSYTGQLGSEIYYRPPFGYANGATFEVFARIFDTFYDQSGGPTDSKSLQGMAGARWKPFGDYNLVLEVDKLFRFGANARDDTLLRAAYSHTVGTDLRVTEPSWFTTQIYGEIDKYLQVDQLVMIAEGRFGESFRLDAINSNLVFFPHAVLAANYDDSFANKQAYSAGLGGSVRYWFGETKYLAPPSYLELTLQYRFRIAGDSRAEGIFAQALVNY